MNNIADRTRQNLARFENWSGKQVKKWTNRADQIRRGMTPTNIGNLASDLAAIQLGIPSQSQIRNQRFTQEQFKANTNPRDQRLAAFMALRKD